MSTPLLEKAGKEESKHVDPKEEAERKLEAERALIARTDTKKGLSEDEVVERRAEWGYNELPEKKVNPCLVFLGYFWGPMPIMIWLAILIEAFNGAWEDFGVLMILQAINGTVGYIEERNAGNAIAALKQSLAPMCRVCRSSVWQTLPSRLLVPGDLIEVVIGGVVPADAILLGDEPLQVDQSALTGESLPVTIHPGGKLKMGSSVKQGEANCIVSATGRNTFFGEAAGMIEGVEVHGRFQKILFKITLWLLALSLVLCSIIFTVLIMNKEKALRALSVVIVLLVASIPIAMQVVCTSTMAVGSRRLAQRKVIVARLSAIEELAGMTILCSDKTGTLTQNKLSLREPMTFGSEMNDEELIFFAALAAKRAEGNQDAIDFCITQAVKNKRKLKSFQEVKFVPFNPTDKRTESTVRAPDDDIFKVTKGAPQVILALAHNAPELQARVDGAVQEFADRGFRALGVAISYTGIDEPSKWEFMGLLALFDPPRYDTKQTIETAVDMGVEVKMITGDQTAIAKETCRELGMGTNILNTEHLVESSDAGMSLDEVILHSNGFAEVYPKHKFQIVDRIRKQGFVTGMTGDGVNDAPALKRADIGIAVEGATDAAKAAADIVLIEPGLSVIIEAIQRSRKIFQRMRNYCIYRIACTIELLLFFFFAVLSIDPADYAPDPAYGVAGGRCAGKLWGDANGHSTWVKSFTLPVMALVIITILNDGTIITIAHDKVIPDRRPQKWDLTEVVIVSTVLGAVACLSSMLLLVLGLKSSCGSYPVGQAPWFVHLFSAQRELDAAGKESDSLNPYMPWGDIQTMIYCKISLSDFLTVFAARTRGFFWERRPGYALATAFVFATSVSTILSLEWDLSRDSDREAGIPKSRTDMIMGKIAPSTVGGIWIFSMVWFFIQDIAKVLAYFVLTKLRSEDEELLKTKQRLMRMTNAMESDTRAKRKAKLTRTESMSGFARSASQSSFTGMDMEAIRQRIVAIEGEMHRITKLEREMAELKRLMPGAGAAAGAGSS